MTTSDHQDRQGQNDLVRRFREARRANTPLISIATPDQFATVRLLAKNGNGGSVPTPKITWNLADGFAPVNAADEASIRAIAEATGGKLSNDPATALAMAVKLPQRTILFFHNAQRFIAESVPGSTMIMQRISNLRDVWKEDKRTLVLLGFPWRDGTDRNLPVSSRSLGRLGMGADRRPVDKSGGGVERLLCIRGGTTLCDGSAERRR
jgi:hypothetical protein